jgi:Fe-Mn family superoxide dismutase
MTMEPDSDGRFQLPPLPYPADSLTPAIDKETMELHHGRHHAAYVEKLNQALAERPSLQGQPLDVLLARAGTLHADVRENAGQHFAHSFFWDTMAPEGRRGDIAEPLLSVIERDFGSLEALKDAFNDKAASHFGSGWAWLVRARNGRLVVGTTANEVVPLMDISPLKGTPLLVNDLWEHAFYLGYRNRRADYLEAWWDVVNWSRVSERHAAITTARVQPADWQEQAA